MTVLQWIKDSFRLERHVAPPTHVRQALEAEESLLREVGRLAEQAKVHAAEMDQLSSFVRSIRQSEPKRKSEGEGN